MLVIDGVLVASLLAQCSGADFGAGPPAVYGTQATYRGSCHAAADSNYGRYHCCIHASMVRGSAHQRISRSEGSRST